jgi:TonB family protein
MDILSRSTATLAIAIAATIILSACYTSSLRTDAVQRTNSALQEQDQGIDSTPNLPKDQIMRLWRDKPEYVALTNAPPPAKRMRLISAVPPRYPYMLHFHVEATVVVSFVVGKDGRVEDARVVESSDSRFDSSAIDAILKFTWIPAEDSTGGPAREMANMPFHFKPTLKAQNGSTGL